MVGKTAVAGLRDRAKPIYLRHPDGRIRIDDTGDRLIEDQIAAVPSTFKAWRESVVSQL